MKMNSRGMELPIAVMIVFFVSIAVAMLVINFAGQIITQGETQLKEFSLECTKEADFFVETYAADTATLVRLADLCYKNHLGTYEGDKICYIVHGMNGVSADPGAVATGLVTLHPDLAQQPPIVDLSQAGKTVYIWFRQLPQNVEVGG